MSQPRTLVVNDAGELLGAPLTMADGTEAVVRARAMTTPAGVVDEAERIYAVLAAQDRKCPLAGFDDALQGSESS